MRSKSQRTRSAIFRASSLSFFFLHAPMAFIIAGCPTCNSAAKGFNAS
jgi:hypothetical protein